MSSSDASGPAAGNPGGCCRGASRAGCFGGDLLSSSACWVSAAPCRRGAARSGPSSRTSSQPWCHGAPFKQLSPIVPSHSGLLGGHQGMETLKPLPDQYQHPCTVVLVLEEGMSQPKAPQIPSGGTRRCRSPISHVLLGGGAECLCPQPCACLPARARGLLEIRPLAEVPERGLWSLASGCYFWKIWFLK